MKDVLNACQVDALLPCEELDHANPSDVIFRIAPAVGGRPLRLDQVLALVNDQGARVEVDDLAGDAGREYGPPGGDRRHALTLSHITPGAEHSPAPHCHIFIPKISLIGSWAQARGSPIEMPGRVRSSDAGDRAVHPAPPQGLPSDRGGQSPAR